MAHKLYNHFLQVVLSQVLLATAEGLVPDTEEPRQEAA